MSKSSLFSQFAMDAKKVTEGVQIKFAPNPDGSEPTFIVSRMATANPKYVKVLERITRPFKRQIQLETLPDEKANHIRLQVFIEAVLQGWENVLDENGNPLSYTADNAFKLFQQLPDLFVELESQASNAALFKLEEAKEQAKN